MPHAFRPCLKRFNAHACPPCGDSSLPTEEMLRRLDATRLRYTPGDGWGYSNVGYLYVAKIIERLSGLALEEALTRMVFSPLGLSGIRLATTPADLQDVNMGTAPAYDPGWVYHGLLVGPLDQAAVCLDRLLTGQTLPPALLREMQTARTLGGPIAGRPWVAPGYALGLMQGAVEGGLVLSGHTGGGPGSVIAVYRCGEGDHTASCAVFAEGGAEGAVEAEAVSRLLNAVIQ